MREYPWYSPTLIQLILLIWIINIQVIIKYNNMWLLKYKSHATISTNKRRNRVVSYLCHIHMRIINPVSYPLRNKWKQAIALQQISRHCEFETWQPCTSEGRCLEGKEEDQGSVRWRDLGGVMTNCSWCALLRSDEPTQTITSPPPKPASSHWVRGWCSLMYGYPSYTGQVYQSHH